MLEVCPSVPPPGPDSRPACLDPARSGVSGKPYRRLSRDMGGLDGGGAHEDNRTEEPR